MQLNTMAMQITSKNWSVAAAILGHEITGRPMNESYGAYVVINTFVPYGDMYYSPPRARNHFSGQVNLHNTLLSAEDFQTMFDYDKRAKNLENFFPVTQINGRPKQVHPDQEVDDAINQLNTAWRRDEQ